MPRAQEAAPLLVELAQKELLEVSLLELAQKAGLLAHPQHSRGGDTQVWQ
jgi:hypothetical protein